MTPSLYFYPKALILIEKDNHRIWIPEHNTTPASVRRLSDNFITKLKKDNELQYVQNREKPRNKTVNNQSSRQHKPPSGVWQKRRPNAGDLVRVED